MRHNYIEDDNFEPDMPFSEFLRKKRRILGYNQGDFGKLLGVNQGTISVWELGVTSPTFDRAREIAKQLGAEIHIDNRMTGSPDLPFGYNPYQE